MTTESAAIGVVDDDPDLLNAVRRLLSTLGYRVIAFASSEEYLLSGQTSGIACLLLDVNAGAVSGLELAAQLRANGATVPIIFMSGEDSVAARHAATALGCADFLHKPFQSVDLIAALRKAGIF